MNTLQDIKKQHNINNKDLATIFNVHPNTINNMLGKNIDMLTFNQIRVLKEYINIPYNSLFGEQVFTTENIDIQDVSKARNVSVSDTLITDEVIELIAAKVSDRLHK